jgi:hypothetical protein
MSLTPVPHRQSDRHPHPTHGGRCQASDRAPVGPQLAKRSLDNRNHEIRKGADLGLPKQSGRLPETHHFGQKRNTNPAEHNKKPQ